MAESTHPSAELSPPPSTSRRDPRWIGLYQPPWLLPFVALALTIACGFAGFPVRVANDLDTLLHGDPAYLVYRDFLDRLGSDESVAIFTRTGPITRPVLLDLFDLRERLGRLGCVRRVTTVLDLIPKEATAGRATLQEWAGRARSLARLTESIARSRLAQRRLVSADGNWLALVVRLDLPAGAGSGIQAARRLALARLREGCLHHFGAREFRMLGYPVIEERVLELVRDSNAILIPLATLVGGAVLWIVFRRFLFVVAAMCPILSALVWTVAAFRLRDYTLNPFSTMLLPLLLTVGLTTTIYVLASYLAHARASPGLTGERLDRQVLPEVFPPTLLCTTTTFIGFLSLAWTDIPEVRNFGIYDALGTVLCLVAVLAYVPGILRLARFGEAPSTPSPGGSRRERDDLAIRLVLLTRRVLARRRTVLGLLALALVLSAEGIRRLPFESGSIAGLYADDPIIESKRLYEQSFEPVLALELLARLPDDRPFLDLAGFHAILGLQRSLEKIPGVARTLSVADLLLDAASFVAKAEKHDIPTDRELSLLASFLEVDMESRLLDEFLADGQHLARVRVSITCEGSIEILDLAGRIRNAAREALPPGSAIEVTGRHLLSAVAHKNTMDNEISSFALALAAILVVLALIFGSPAVALAAAVPNLLPLVFTYGAMGWLSIPFNVSTGMVPCILIGLVVDDTIHAMFRYRETRLRLTSASLAVRCTIRRVGRAVVSTALVLCAGMGVMAFSRFRIIVQFGGCMALAIAAGVVTELFVTPAVLVTFPRLLAPRRAPRESPGP